MKLYRERVEAVIGFFIRLIVMIVSAVVVACGSLFYYLYLCYRPTEQDQQNKKNNNTVTARPFRNFKEASKFWCAVKSLKSDTDDDDDDDDLEQENGLSPEESSCPRHVKMSNSCVSVSTLLEAANQAEKKREEKSMEDGKNLETADVILIPLELITGLIGMRGKHIKEIETLTNTKISIKLENEGGRTTMMDSREKPCVIRGKSEDVVEAQGLIRDYIASCPPIIVREISIPKTFVGLIIGRRGETRRFIQKETKVKFNVEQKKIGRATTTNTDDQEVGEEMNENETNPDEEPLSRVVLKGTQDQIDYAERLIWGIIEKEQERQRTKEALRWVSPTSVQKNRYKHQNGTATATTALK